MLRMGEAMACARLINPAQKLFFHQGVVPGEELQFAGTETVAAAVANIGEPERGRIRRIPQRADEGCAHALQVGRPAGVAEDGVVGGFNRLLEAGVRVARRIGRVGIMAGGGLAGCVFWACGAARTGATQGFEESFAGEMAGNLLRLRRRLLPSQTTKALMCWPKRRAGVLIGVAHEAAMREHREGAGMSEMWVRPRMRGLAAWRVSGLQCLPCRHPGRSPRTGIVANNTPGEARSSMAFDAGG